jgi:hypothetical protein
MGVKVSKCVKELTSSGQYMDIEVQQTIHSLANEGCMLMMNREKRDSFFQMER